VVASIPVGEEGTEDIAITPDGSLALVTIENSVKVIATATNLVVGSVPVGVDPHGVAITPDGALAYVADGDSEGVSVVDIAGQTVTATLPDEGQPWGIAITPPIEGEATPTPPAPPSEPNKEPASSTPPPSPPPSVIATPAVIPTPPPALPKHKKPLKCRKGFKKQKLHGKQKCVRVKQKRHRR
jgi:YVTN family beta-propeller protein